MRREFQSVKSDTVDDNGKDVEDHVQSVTEHKEYDRKDHEHEVAQQRTGQFVHGCGDGGTGEADCPQTDIRNDIREDVDNAQQNGNDVLQTFQNRLDDA